MGESNGKEKPEKRGARLARYLERRVWELGFERRRFTRRQRARRNGGGFPDSGMLADFPADLDASGLSEEVERVERKGPE